MNKLIYLLVLLVLSLPSIFATSLLYDDFNRADSATVGSASGTGQTWIQIGGAGAISNN